MGCALTERSYFVVHHLRYLPNRIIHLIIYRDVFVLVKVWGFKLKDGILSSSFLDDDIPSLTYRIATDEG